ncbi:tyrosine--tRNA ligase [Candidatus Daviesbacteria bacterium RIFCSPLOWO2_02_FULL_40_8]|uniref:tyrosine--tRNA ligase n=1 Tax=Candidatus Daviesbacteria bacterium RIFCSPLOWO2_01_FULL_40_24 TaxID=1797787 RepID=A0A1F5MIW9_9BACT|nr:MAG: tyrosine--tRNA ligase [Candidatus Daviesbacteria bacterium RIFCSPHIGHO2_01_FULL_41_45]OGE35554.1 MAG: tyrosine--tRNA ligase [Candidatus Daviesbacteria bacterium RIFCSPHIGHO2_02_FULL_41_14]OGE65303.1 MAG: tyrosine--tRNA ligase [Candidatus Daviesbacteria bacterium RIFCSPLOWO2_01_FULL_40_24]OGE66951.1 MAG: tyrosine--tRNA ligase [Candidatus Daviesbacteria bacterium RIFCSPLOWO2_02_FULL_40_8]
MTTDEKVKLITRNLQEILTEEELRHLIDSETPLKHYIGYEVSGKLHIGHLFGFLKIKDLIDAGAETTIFLADLHSAINDKLDGNLDTIQRVSREYFIPAAKILLQSIGADPNKVRFVTTSELYTSDPDKTWQTFLSVAKNTTLARNLRSITIMGRENTEDLDSAKLMYPIMQATDIFLLQANIAHAGLDQRKVHVIARDVAYQIKTSPLKDSRGTPIKPVAIHHPILLGLDYKGEIVAGESDEIAMKTKMSKSKADSAVSVHDDPAEIKRKVMSAYAPPNELENNPIINWVQNLIFYGGSGNLKVDRAEQHGGTIIYDSWEKLAGDYTSGILHPMDLKSALAEWLINLLEPVRTYFENPDKKSILDEIERLTIR